MEVLTPGHKYIAHNFEDTRDGQTIQFIEKTLKGDAAAGELETVNDGTTNEEMLAILLDRLAFLYNKFPSQETKHAITHLQEGLFWLEHRTANRIKRQVEGKHLA